MVLTGIGRTMAEIPIDPRLARMIAQAGRLGVVREVTILAAALSIQDVRERPVDQRDDADRSHARFADPASDFLTYLNLWEYLRETRRENSSSAFRRQVRAEFLNYLRIREWQDLVTQLRRILRPLGLAFSPREDPAPAPHPADTLTTRDKFGPRDSPASALSAHPGVSAPAAHPAASPDTSIYRLMWDAEAIHRSLIPGLLSQLGQRVETEVAAVPATRSAEARDRRPKRGPRNDYLGARGTRFAIFPGSPLHSKPPPWVMAAELVETSRLWARDVAGIDPAWAEDAAGELVRRVYAEPRWSAKQGAAIVTEKVLLYGLPIIPARAVPLARTDRPLAREMLIRHALVDGEWRTHHTFFRANRDLLDQADQLVHRTRDRSFSVDPEDLFAFYDARLPASAVSARHFDSWWSKARRHTPDLLTLTPDALGLDAVPPAERGFPDVWITGPWRLPVTYTFAPGEVADGATVHIPIAVANQIPADGFDWQVPGLRADLIAALIKSLPKRERVNLVPAPDTARAAVAALGDLADWRDPAGRIPPLTEALAKVFREMRDVIVPPEAWSYDRVPDHLRLRFAVENARGEVMASGLDLAAVVHEANPHIRAAIASVAKASGVDGQTAPPAADAVPPPAEQPPPEVVAWPGERPQVETWDFGDLPREIRVDVGGGVTVRGYPALVEVEAGPGVALRVLTDPAQQAAAHPLGVRALLLGELRLATARVTSRWTSETTLAMASWRGGNAEVLVSDLQSAAVDALMAEAGGVPWTQGGYVIVRGRLLDRLEDRVHRLALAVAEVLRAVHAVEVRLGDLTEMAVLNSAADLRRHLDALMAPGFVTRAGEARLSALRRYVAADAYRLDHLGSTRAREQQGIWLVEQMWEAYRTALGSLSPGAPEPPAVAEIPWMIEELRVSLFAQHLGTAYPVSEKRIRRAIAAALA
jgi:ATP-dependent helicase HrpA